MALTDLLLWDGKQVWRFSMETLLKLAKDNMTKIGAPDNFFTRFMQSWDTCNKTELLRELRKEFGVKSPRMALYRWHAALASGQFFALHIQSVASLFSLTSQIGQIKEKTNLCPNPVKARSVDCFYLAKNGSCARNGDCPHQERFS